MKKALRAACSIFMLCAILASCAQPLAKLSAKELLDLGEKYLQEQDYKQAVVYFERLIEVEPKNARGYIGLAKAYMGLEQPEEAAAVLKKGLEELPEDPDILSLMEELSLSLPEPDAETPEQPGEMKSAENPGEAVSWDMDEWVINGMNVFETSPGVFREAFGEELIEQWDEGQNVLNMWWRGFSASYGAENEFISVHTSNHADSGMRGITVGETSVDEVFAMFPLPDVKPITVGGGEHTAYESAKNHYTWGFREPEGYPAWIEFEGHKDGWLYHYWIQFDSDGTTEEITCVRLQPI